jgi:hypothetical protein
MLTGPLGGAGEKFVKMPGAVLGIVMVLAGVVEVVVCSSKLRMC